MKIILGVFISWLIPGSGYWLVGKPKTHLGTLILGCLSLLILTGMLLADFRDVRFADNPFYYAGRFGSGLTYFIAAFFLSSTPAGITHYQYFDIGHLYLCVAGALNIVVVLNILSQLCKVTPMTRPGEISVNGVSHSCGEEIIN